MLTARIRESTFTNCTATAHGGAIYACNVRNVTIEHCRFSECSSQQRGGAISVETSIARILASDFDSNYIHTTSSQVTAGGAISAHQSHVLVEGCTFAANRATARLGMGGAIALSQPYPTATARQSIVRNCFFRDNAACVIGGAMYADMTDVFMLRCTFIRNTVSSTVRGEMDHSGGALGTVENAVVIFASQFDSNEALTGGACSFMRASAEMTECRFRNNTAHITSGAIHATETRLSASLCQFTRNRITVIPGVTIPTEHHAGGGAVGLVSPMGATFHNSSFVENRGFPVGGALYAKNAFDAVLLIDRCAFLRNTATHGGGGISLHLVPAVISSTTLRANTVQPHNAGGLAGTDPLLALPGGGGLFVFDGELTLKHCTVDANQAPAGGGIFLVRSGASLNATSLTSNTATGSDGGGGLCSIESSALSLSHGVLVSNRAPVGGAICLRDVAQAQVNHSYIANNTASAAPHPSTRLSGGGIVAQATAMPRRPTLLLFDDVFAHNEGGALALRRYTARALRCRFSRAFVSCERSALSLEGTLHGSNCAANTHKPHVRVLCQRCELEHAVCANGLALWVLLLIAGGGAAVVVVVALTVCLCCCKARRRDPGDRRQRASTLIRSLLQDKDDQQYSITFN